MSRAKTEWRLTSEIPKKTNEPPIADNKPSTEWRLTTPAQEQEAFYKQPLRDVGIGLAHAGRNLHNLPHDLAASMGEQGNKFRAAINEVFPFAQQAHKFPAFDAASYLPYDEQDYSEVFGQKGEPTFPHKAIQKGFEYAPELMMAGNAIRKLPHLTKRGATKKLRAASQLNKEGQIGRLDVNPELIEDMRQFLPDTKIYRDALDAAHTGDYQKLFDLQSKVGRHSAPRAKAWFDPEARDKGQAGFNSVNALLDDMHAEMQGQGLLKESEFLRQGRNDYRRYMNFKPYRNAVGAAIAGTIGATLIPKNALTNLIQKMVMHKVD